MERGEAQRSSGRRCSVRSAVIQMSSAIASARTDRSSKAEDRSSNNSNSSNSRRSALEPPLKYRSRSSSNQRAFPPAAIETPTEYREASLETSHSQHRTSERGSSA